MLFYSQCLLIYNKILSNSVVSLLLRDSWSPRISVEASALAGERLYYWFDCSQWALEQRVAALENPTVKPAWTILWLLKYVLKKEHGIYNVYSIFKEFKNHMFCFVLDMVFSIQKIAKFHCPPILLTDKETLGPFTVLFILLYKNINCIYNIKGNIVWSMTFKKSALWQRINSSSYITVYISMFNMVQIWNSCVWSLECNFMLTLCLYTTPC